VYLGLYQAITGPEERQKLFREFSAGFFDHQHGDQGAIGKLWRPMVIKVATR
jgi:hypothetical protein